VPKERNSEERKSSVNLLQMDPMRWEIQLEFHRLSQHSTNTNHIDHRSQCSNKGTTIHRDTEVVMALQVPRNISFRKKPNNNFYAHFRGVSGFFTKYYVSRPPIFSGSKFRKPAGII
jgi:hypothetical protein